MIKIKLYFISINTTKSTIELLKKDIFPWDEYNNNGRELYLGIKITAVNPC